MTDDNAGQASHDGNIVSDQIKPRRLPAQIRSQERVDRIIKAACDVLAEVGYDDLSLREVARRANVPIGTIYQFFPSRAALIRYIGERNIKHLDGAVLRILNLEPDHPERWVYAALQCVAEAYRSAPVFIEAWAGIQANPASRALDNADTLDNAAKLRYAIQAHLPLLGETESHELALAIMVGGSAVMRFMLQVSEAEGEALLRGFARLLVSQVRLSRE